MLNRMIFSSQVNLTYGPPAIPADFIVTNDAEWDAVFANDAATLSGKIVEVQGSGFTARQITGLDIAAEAAPLTLRCEDANAHIPRLRLRGTVTGIDFAGFNFQMTDWPKTHDACLFFDTGVYDQIRFLDGTTFRHGYEASLADIDTAAQLPEYTRVDHVQTATTTSAAYPLSWLDAAATGGIIEFFNRGTETVYVATGGAGVTASAADREVLPGKRQRLGLDPTIDTHFAVIAASGTSEVNARAEIGLGYYLANAFQSSGAANMGTLEVRNCLFRDLSNAVKGIPGSTQSLVVMDNDFDRVYQDIAAFALGDGGKARVFRNLYTLPFSRSGIAENLNGDAGDPHGDTVQMFGPGTHTMRNVWAGGNRQRIGNLRAGATSQGYFISDNDFVPGYEDFVLVSEMLVGGSTAQIAIGEETVGPARNLLIYGASVVDWSDVDNASPWIAIATDDGESCYIGSSIAPRIFLGGGNPGRGSDTLELSSKVASAAAVFPLIQQLPAALTRSKIELAMFSSAEGAGLGMAATRDAIDWTTDDPEAVIVWENVPSGVEWRDRSNLTPDTLTELPLQKVLNQRPSQPVSVGAGVEWRSVDVDGVTEVQAWTSADGTIEPGQFIQIRGTTGASGANVTLDLSLNLMAQSVRLTSSSIPTQWLVQGATTGWFADPDFIDPGTVRLVQEMKIFFPGAIPGGATRLFSSRSTGSDIEMFPAGSLAATVEDDTGAKLLNRGVVAPNGTMVPDQWQTLRTEIDHANNRITRTVDGVSQDVPFDAASSGAFSTFEKFSFLARATDGQAPVATGTLIADMSLQLFDVDGNLLRSKTISNDASVANADAWHNGGDFTGAD
ncbi:MAG: hypothetical protein QNI87_12680 [Erythrobacter sp.]|uniref:hypothetical protein n=1 Tax=Erythrobacter sp. TaxID=1042 RepID=UPI0026282E94|nr:hypothetical protein [Erythrobacter sp.]MDJ0979374.1 hypothetical protein [Erythrobacter sp.]